MNRSLNKMDILQMVKRCEITPEEGLQRIKELEKETKDSIIQQSESNEFKVKAAVTQKKIEKVQGMSAEQQKKDFEDLITRAQESYLQRTYAMMAEIKKEDETGKSEEAVAVTKTAIHKEKVIPKETDVAVIGMSGKFPGANNLDVYWENLKNGVDCVTEIPKERWDWESYYDEDPKAANKSVSKWMGALEDVNKFDPLFFNLSHAEAELMDPQQRKFLEEAWKAIEDAGYSPDSMNGKQCGVFVGALTSDYMMLTKTSGKPLNALFLTGSGNSFISARIAYLLNLKGPNLSIDTACSSSLVAIYEAYKSIITKESEMALAGGVCIMATPDMHLTTSKAGLLSPSGVCKVFDDEADGIAIGEGVGVLVLKPLAKALEDHDHIYGVIKGGGINQDGKTNGITSPSANSQAQLEMECYKHFNINPADIDYIECHGTGTKLGDPIEITALTKAFEHFTDKKEFCTVGSVKANIGHGLASSGIASIMKVLLSLEHKKMIPLIHYNKQNHLIHFKDSPFKVNTSLKDWKVEGKKRIAAVSSFGLSGTNCHMILEEAPNFTYNIKEEQKSYLFLLSAKTEEAYSKKIEELSVWLKEHGNKYTLRDISYTLQVGRSDFPIRVAIIASSKEELEEKIRMLIEHKVDPEIKTGNLYQSAYLIEKTENDKLEEVPNLVDTLSESDYRKMLNTLAERYCAGESITHEELYARDNCYRIPMPVYPFEQDMVWIQKEETETSLKRNCSSLHPLIDENISTLEEQCFKKTFSLHDFCMKEHVIKGKMVLPGAAYLEMANTAAQFASHSQYVNKLINITWERPLELEGEKREVFIGFYPENKDVAFHIYTNQGDGIRQVHARGKVEYETAEKSEERKSVEISEIINRCKKLEAGSIFYEGFKDLGLELGASFQTVKELYGNGQEALAKIQLWDDEKECVSDFTLHPGMLDGALQTAAGLVLDKIGGKEAMYLPYGLKELEVYKPLTKICYSHVVLCDEEGFTSQEVRFNVHILDEKGQILVEMRQVVGRLFVKPEKQSEVEQVITKQEKRYRISDLLKKLENGDIEADEVNQILEGM